MEKFCRINCEAYVKDMCAVQPSTACPTPSPTTTSTLPPTPAPTTYPALSQFIFFPQELAVDLLASLVIFQAYKQRSQEQRVHQHQEQGNQRVPQEPLHRQV